MTEIPPYLFIVTSTALVLGVAITLRGLWGFRPIPAATGALASGAEAPGATDAVETHAMVDATSTSDAPDAPVTADLAPAPTSAYQVRDLREPIVMTIAGVLICLFTILGIAALVNSA